MEDQLLPVSGRCSPEFEPVRARFEQNFRDGLEVGASVAITLGGELVVDLWGGFADEYRNQPWREESIVNAFSTTKTMTSLCALMLVDRHEIDIDAPVAKYWPEFAQNGKSNILVRHVLSHGSGLSGWQAPMTELDLLDWEKATALLAAQAPWWPPGSASGYHAQTFGYLIGEIVRRVTGRPMAELFAREIAQPLAADFFMGLPAAEDDRVVNVIPPPAYSQGPRDMRTVSSRTITNPSLSVEFTWTEGWKRAENGGAGGIGNARGVARLHGALANGGSFEGKRLISAATCELPLQEQSYGVDLVVGVPVRTGIGFALSSPLVPLLGGSFGWGGWGGSIAAIDPQTKMSFAYVMNRMLYAPAAPGSMSGPFGDVRGAGLLASAYAALAASNG